MHGNHLQQISHPRQKNTYWSSSWLTVLEASSPTGTIIPIIPPLPRTKLELYIRDKLRANLLMKQLHLEVDLRHLSLYNDELAHAIQEKPGEILPLVSFYGIPHHILLLILICKMWCSSKVQQQEQLEQSSSLWPKILM